MEKFDKIWNEKFFNKKVSVFDMGGGDYFVNGERKDYREIVLSFEENLKVILYDDGTYKIFDD